MQLDVPKEQFAQIEAMIACADSPVGIDAKKTHIIIIQKLMEIERRLERLETQLRNSSGRK